MDFRKPTISVVVPTYNGMGNLAHVFNSIERQTCIKNVAQIIVIDDASTLPRKKETYDSLVREYSKLPIEVIYQERNGGPATARNRGIKRATGDIVFFTDDDCDLPANTFELHLGAYRDKPQISGVGGWYQSLSHIVRENTIERYVFARYLHFFGLSMYRSASLSSDYFRYFWLFPAGNTANLSAKRYVFSDILFDEDFIAPGSEDAFFSEEIRRKGYLLEYIPLFVTHTKNLSRKKFWRFCYNRGMGSFVYRKKYGRKSKMDLFVETKKFNETLLKLSREYPALGQRRYRLLFLNAVRVFFAASRVMNMVYAAKYFLKRGYMPKQKYVS